jgi:hypothetical protein
VKLWTPPLEALEPSRLKGGSQFHRRFSCAFLLFFNPAAFCCGIFCHCAGSVYRQPIRLFKNPENQKNIILENKFSIFFGLEDMFPDKV